MYQVMDPWVVAVENDFLTHGGIVDEHHNKIKKSQTIETETRERKFLTFQF